MALPPLPLQYLTAKGGWRIMSELDCQTLTAAMPIETYNKITKGEIVDFGMITIRRSVNA